MNEVGVLSSGNQALASHKSTGTTRVGIAGAGAPGVAHARGVAQASGMKVVAVADPIAERRRAVVAIAPGCREYNDAQQLVDDVGVDLICVCLPTALHAGVVTAALKAGKHVVIEPPPGVGVKQAKQIESATLKSGKTVVYALQRRFGAGEQATRQAIEKGYVGDVRHVRVAWMRTRGIPAGTGWYTDPVQSGGGALIDLGLHMFDLGWSLAGCPRPLTVFARTHAGFTVASNAKPSSKAVEDSAFALVAFEGGGSMELACSWAINQPPEQEGVTCRVYGSEGSINTYTPQGAVLYRPGDGATMKATPLKAPKMIHHGALMRHVRECVLSKCEPTPGPADGVVLMQVIEAMYRSADSGKSETVKG